MTSIDTRALEFRVVIFLINFVTDGQGRDRCGQVLNEKAPHHDHNLQVVMILGLQRQTISRINQAPRGARYSLVCVKAPLILKI